MTDAADRVRASADLLARFASLYAGRHDPRDALDWLDDDTATSAIGTPGPGAGLDRTALYRADAPEEQRDRVRQQVRQLAADRSATLRALAEMEEAPAPAGTGPSTDRGAGTASRRWIPIVAVALAVAALTGGVAVTLHSSRSATATAADARRLERTVVQSRGDRVPADFYLRFPAALAAGWRGGAMTSHRSLDGATPVQVALPAGTTEVLLIVACSSADRSFQYAVLPGSGDEADARGFGACGALAPIVVPVRPGAHRVGLLVSTRGVDPFSATVLVPPASG